jgi:nucleotide-binding universal stress UspA family protein
MEMNMNIQSILVLTDLSKGGDRALERAAMIAVKQRALLRVIHVAADDRRHCTDALERVHHQGRQLAERFGIAVKTVGHAESSLECLVEEARRSDLLVLSEGKGTFLTGLLGSERTVQLMRRCNCPVLVTRLDARKRYGRILVAADLTLESTDLVQLAFAIDDDAEVELFHAVRLPGETKLPCTDASAHPVPAFRAACTPHAAGRIISFTDSFDARRNRVMSTLKRGDPTRQAAIQQQYVRAGLLVIGNRRRSWLMDFLAGNVAQRVLACSAGDVLVVPHDFQVRTPAPVVSPGSQARKNYSPAFLSIKRSLP